MSPEQARVQIHAIDEELLECENDGPPSLFECCICLETPQNPVVTLCGHLFCYGCLAAWLKLHATERQCPVCKKRVGKVVRILGQGNFMAAASAVSAPASPCKSQFTAAGTETRHAETRQEIPSSQTLDMPLESASNTGPFTQQQEGYVGTPQVGRHRQDAYHTPTFTAETRQPFGGAAAVSIEGLNSNAGVEATFATNEIPGLTSRSNGSQVLPTRRMMDRRYRARSPTMSFLRRLGLSSAA